MSNSGVTRSIFQHAGQNITYCTDKYQKHVRPDQQQFRRHHQQEIAKMIQDRDLGIAKNVGITILVLIGVTFVLIALASLVG